MKLQPFSCARSLAAVALGLLWLGPGCAHRPSGDDVDHVSNPLTVSVGAAAATGTAPSPAPVASPAKTTDPALPPLRLDGSDWLLLFDGQSLAGWKVTDFAGHGEVTIESGELRVGMGAMLSGVTLTNDPPRLDYEVALEAMKTEGSDFFCGLTAPYANTNFSLIIGGWGGGLVGISSIDGGDASSNETTKFMKFDGNKWYRIRLKVTRPKLEAWIDDQKIIDADVRDRSIGMRPGEIEVAVPLSLSTYQTGAAYRDIRIRRLPPP